MRPNLSEIVHATLHRKRYRIKRYVRVKPLWKRDARGRFVRLLRRGYSYTVKDRSRPMVTGMQLVAENISANNSLLAALKGRKPVF